VAAATGAGLPVPVVVGTRFALEAGRGRSAVPVRPALLGAVAGVLGVLAAFTFSAGVSDAAANPARFGQTWQLDTFFGEDGHDFPAAANKQWPGTGGQGQNGSSGVAQAVKTTDGGIGYAELSYATANSLQTAKVGNAQGQFVAASTDAATTFISKAKVTQTGSDIQLAFDYTFSDPSAYPAVLVTYEIACASGNDSAQLPLIKGFLGYMASDNAQAELPAAGYVKLPTNIQGLVKTAVAGLS